MKISPPKLHILVDSRESSISFAKYIFEKEENWSLGTVTHIRDINLPQHFQKISSLCNAEDTILISTYWLSKEQLKKVQQITHGKAIAPEQVILASYDCFSHLPAWCESSGCHFRQNPLKRRTLPHEKASTDPTSPEPAELTRIWIQYRLILSIISRTEDLKHVSRQLILGQPEKGATVSKEQNRAIRYFELGEPDMAGGSYSGEGETTRNPIDLLRARINKIAATDFNVLIQGESGSGKEAVAWAIHELSTRRDNPFVTINCAGIPDELLESEMFGYMKGSHNQAFEDTPGFLETAAGGTLFLDELPEMSTRVQAKLLRFLENGEYRPLGGIENRYADVRIIAAGQPDRLDATTGIRPDLKSRISQLGIDTLPLRTLEQQSPGTVFKIAFVLLERYTWTTIFHNDRICELAPVDIKKFQNALTENKNSAQLSRQQWKESNIRELNNFLRQWVVFGDDEFRQLTDQADAEDTLAFQGYRFDIYDDALRSYLQEPKNRNGFKNLANERPLHDLKKSYIRHLFRIYSRIVSEENGKRDTPQKATQKEFAKLMNINENTLSRLLN